MPTVPSYWHPGPLSPQQLNADLYSYNGTGYGGNGILFHSHRVLLHESMSQSALFTVSPNGTWNGFPGASTTAFSIIDTAALFGVGSDNPGGFALYQFIPQALGASGVGYTPGFTSPVAASTVPAIPQGAGGNYLVSHFATGQTAATTPAAIGAGMYYTPGLPGEEDFISTGAIQAHSTALQGCAPLIDLINAGGSVAGTVASPLAHQPIATTYLAQGEWDPAWTVSISGTASASDVNNFSLVLGITTIATSTNAGTIGTFAQGIHGAAVTVATGQYLSVTAGAVTPTSAATYAATIFGQNMPLIGNGNTFQPAGLYADASATTEQIPTNPADTAGFTPRHTWIWAAVAYQGIMVTANSNPYTPNGNLSGWQPLGGSITAVTPPGNPPPVPSGVLLTPDGATSQTITYAGSLSVTPGTQYQVTANFFPAGSSTVITGLSWYNTGGGLLSSVSATQAATANSWTAVTCWGTAPAGAVTAQPWGGLTSSGVMPGTQTTYIAGIAVPGQVPSPQASWSGGLTSALMNGPSGPRQALALLNNPPVMRQGHFTAPTIPNATNTVVYFNPDAPVLEIPVIDTYSAYNATLGAYIAPLAGLYLAFTTMPFTGNTTGIRRAGFQVTASGGGVTTLNGPAYSAVSNANIATSAVAVRVLDLNANDAVAPLCYQSSGGGLALSTQNPPGYQPHFGMMYLCPYSSGGVQAFTPPLTSFHWYAGLPAGDLLAYLDEHLGNDLNFLVNRPYFTGYQATAQSGLPGNAWSAVTIDTPAGLIHGNPGDNYGGWNSSTYMYVAQQPGWYLVIAEVYATIPSAATGYLAAGISCPSSGGVNPTASPDQYQTVFFPVTSGSLYPGAFAMGMYYLAQNESVQPMIKASNWGGSYGTAVSTQTRSQFTCIWMAE